jgi:phage baseplate assembly protein W
MPIGKDIKFSDLNLTFAKHPVTGKISVLKNNDAIIRAVRNLVLTNHWERPYNQLFGGNVTSKLFENFTKITEDLVKRDIQDAFDNWESRAQLNFVNVLANQGGNSLAVTLNFTPINRLEPIEADFIVERTR